MMANNDRLIWNLLMQGIGNPYGVAAVMGNLRAESTLNPMNMTGTKAKQWKSANDYFSAVNSGSYDQYSFAHDGIAVGLAQWLYWSRKQALHEYAKGRDIGSAEVQIGYLLKELPSYKTVWNALLNATNVSDASDIFMLRYEKPGTTTEAAKQKRRDFGITYFDKFYEPAKEKEPAVSEPVETQKDSGRYPWESSVPKIKQVTTTATNVVVRCGNGKEYDPIGKISAKGSSYLWVATSDNGWHAIRIGNRVAWISGSFSEVVEV